MTLFYRMKLSASRVPALQTFFGADFNSFRWFDTLLAPGQIAAGPCVRITSISEITSYLHNGRNGLTQPRVQIDVIGPDPATVSDAVEAIDTWLDHANFVTNGEFASPPTPSNGPASNFRLNARGGTFPATDRELPVTTLDYRIFNVNPS